MNLQEGILNENDLQQICMLGQNRRHLPNQISQNVLPVLSELQDYLRHQNKEDAGHRIQEPRDSNTRGAMVKEGAGTAAVCQAEGSSASGTEGSRRDF